MKDDSGSYAVFTEQGSASHMAAAEKLMDVIAELPDCAGQAFDAVICLHPSKSGGRSKIAQNPKVRVSR